MEKCPIYPIWQTTAFLSEMDGNFQEFTCCFCSTSMWRCSYHMGKSPAWWWEPGREAFLHRDNHGLTWSPWATCGLKCSEKEHQARWARRTDQNLMRHAFVFVVSLSLWYIWCIIVFSLTVTLQSPINHDVMQSGSHAWRLRAPVAVANQTGRIRSSQIVKLKFPAFSCSHIHTRTANAMVKSTQCSTSFKQNFKVQCMNNYKFKIHVVVMWFEPFHHFMLLLVYVLQYLYMQAPKVPVGYVQLNFLFSTNHGRCFPLHPRPHVGSMEMSKGYEHIISI